MAQDRFIVAETEEIVPRYYGLSFASNQQGGIRIFDSPSTAALAYVAITPPDRKGGLVDMLNSWQLRKQRELGGEFGYLPVFTLSKMQQHSLLDCTSDELVNKVREAIKKNHGSYNLFDCAGIESVSALVLRGELLTAEVRSQKAGTYSVNLKGALRGANGENRYADSSCNCQDSRWSEGKGGKSIIVRRNCIHVKAAETESYLQENPRTLHPAKTVMRVKDPREAARAITFNFVDDPFLKYLVSDILVAHELLSENLYSIDRKIMSPIRGEDARLLPSLVAPAIMPLSLQQEVARGRATFEILNQKKNKIRKIDREVLRAQQQIYEAFSRELWREGYQWNGYCLELGQPATRFENGKYALNFAIDSATGLPFYSIRSLEKMRSVSIFTPDYGPQNPFAQLRATQWRIDDRTRKETLTLFGPASELKLPESATTLSLKNRLAKTVLEMYREAVLRAKAHRKEK